MKKINYYVYYDKNGAFLGALKKAGKPVDTNCTQVSEEEFNRILALNHLPTEPAEAEPVKDTTNETETPEVADGEESEA